MNKKTVIIIFIVLCVAIPITYFSWKNLFQQREPLFEQSPGSAPSPEERTEIDEYERKCPAQMLIFDAETPSFNMTHVECSEDPRYPNIAEGEDVTVEIYIPNLETGKAEFRDWLAEHGLEESEKLRVEYVHRVRE